MDNTLIFLLLFLVMGNNNGDCRREDGCPREGESRNESRSRLILDEFENAELTTPYCAARKSISSMEILLFILLFFFVNEVNAPLGAVPVRVPEGERPETRAGNPFYEKF